MPVRTLVVLLAAVLAAVPVSADQDAGEIPASQGVAEQVPVDLVMRLLAIESRDQLVLGAMPEELMQKMPLPPGIDVVATVSHGSPLGRHYQVVATSSMPKTAALRALASSLQGSGWTEPPAQGARWAESRAANNWIELCSAEDWYLNAGVEAQREGPTSLRMTVQTGLHGPQSCADEEGDRRWEGWMDEVMPSLEPPEGEGEAVVSSTSGISGDGFQAIHARIVSEPAEPANAQVDRYASQLVAAGWVIGETMTSSRMAVADVSLEATDGHAAAGYLIAHCGQQDHHSCNVSLVLYRDR